jgi:hypothetical protein
MLIGDNNYMPNRPEAYETDQETVAYAMDCYHCFHQFVGPEYLGFNFGLMKSEGAKGQRTVTLQIIDEEGEARISLQLKESDLRPNWN